MNNFMIGFKRFITNKNVVTIILVIVILVVLYFGYSGSIKKQTNPVSMPVAAQKIPQKTKITGEMVTYKQIAASMVDENAMRNSGEIIDKYTNVNVTIPQGSLFYAEWLIEGSKLKGNWIEGLNHEKGEIGYYMSVNAESTLGNNLLPDTYVDIYMHLTDEVGTNMLGRLMKNIKILVVHDDGGNNVFDDTTAIGTASKIGFAVSPEYYSLLKRIGYLPNVELIVVPRGSTIPDDDYIIVTSSALRDYVNAKTIVIEDDVIPEETETTEAGENTEENTQTQVTE